MISPTDPETAADQIRLALSEPGEYRVLRWDAGIGINVDE